MLQLLIKLGRDISPAPSSLDDEGDGLGRATRAEGLRLARNGLRDETRELGELARRDIAHPDELVEASVLLELVEVVLDAARSGVHADEDGDQGLDVFLLLRLLNEIGDHLVGHRRGVVVTVRDDVDRSVDLEVGGAKLVRVGETGTDPGVGGIAKGRAAACLGLVVQGGVDGVERLEAVDFLKACVEVEEPDHQVLGSRVLLTGPDDLLLHLEEVVFASAQGARAVENDGDEGVFRRFEDGGLDRRELEGRAGDGENLFVRAKVKSGHVVSLREEVGALGDLHAASGQVAHELLAELFEAAHVRGGILDEYELLDVLLAEVARDIADGVGHAVGEGLTGDRDDVHLLQGFDEAGVELGRGVFGIGNVCLNGAVVLRHVVRSLRDEIDEGGVVPLPPADGLEDIALHLVAVRADEAVRGPDAQGVATVLGEGEDVLLGTIAVEAVSLHGSAVLVGRDGGSPFALFDVFRGDDCEGVGVLARRVDPEYRVGDVVLVMGVQRHMNVVDLGRDSPDHGREPLAVVVGSGDIERPGRFAEIDLRINDEKVYLQHATSTNE